MFKRANKITALLVAAASLMSVVPAMADDSASTSRLGTKDGTIENAIAYQDGKYVYQGYKSSDDTDAIYYNGGDQDKALDDVSDSNLNGAYADKYAFANDGSNQYLIDLTSGTVTDDSTPVDDIDTAATKLQTKLKKADRYGDNLGSGLNGTLTETDLEAGQTTGDSVVCAIPGSKFGDTWYNYSVKTGSSDSQKYLAKRPAANVTSNTGYLYGFTDAAGNYIDASYTANVYAYSTIEGKTVKIENYSNNISDADSDSGLLATLVQQPVALTQDKDYIYALVTVAITDTASNSRVTGGTQVNTADYVDGNIATGTTTTMRTYVQKISKAQGDQQDGAYLPKTVDTYEVGNHQSGTTEYDCGDAHDAYSDILGAIGNSRTDLTAVTQGDVVTDVDSDGVSRPKFTVNNGNLVAIQADSSSIHPYTLQFKKDKVKFLTYPGYKNVVAASTTGAVQGFDTTTKFDVYFVETDQDDSFDTGSNATNYDQSYDIDVDGNVWGIADGKVYEYKNGSMTKMYTVDSSLDSLSVYDANDLIAWENNGDVYTTVNEGKAQTAADAGTTTTTTAPAVTTKTGWDQLATGAWNFYDATGAKVASKWINDGGVWYFLKADATMATGWYNDNGTWYFLKSSGAMATGWVQDGGAWYYLNASGAMLADTTTPDGYVVGANGAWVQ